MGREREWPSLLRLEDAPLFCLVSSNGILRGRRPDGERARRFEGAACECALGVLRWVEKDSVGEGADAASGAAGGSSDSAGEGADAASGAAGGSSDSAGAGADAASGAAAEGIFSSDSAAEEPGPASGATCSSNSAGEGPDPASDAARGRFSSSRACTSPAATSAVSLAGIILLPVSTSASVVDSGSASASSGEK